MRTQDEILDDAISICDGLLESLDDMSERMTDRIMIHIKDYIKQICRYKDARFHRHFWEWYFDTHWEALPIIDFFNMIENNGTGDKNE